ncbi:MAG: PilZ domain-containing protein [Candidatus Hydrogenedens sp.]|jgi:hypothetical protein|nr:PilZ domain-containing protein [Candidatus Hydrogenedens sp.]
MRSYLGTGERVFLTIGKYPRRNARIKEVGQDGTVLLSFSNPTALQAGTPVIMELAKEGFSLLYYMRLLSFLPANQPSIQLHRQPVNNQNMKRQAWRVPFSLQTGIRTQKTPHFLGAQFCDLSVLGARLVSEVSFPMDATVEIRLPIPDEQEHIVEATVQRASTKPMGRNPFGQELYEVVLLFKKLPKSAYSDLVRYLWKSVRKHYGEQLRAAYMVNSRKARTKAVDFENLNIPVPGKHEFWKPQS